MNTLSSVTSLSLMLSGPPQEQFNNWVEMPTGITLSDQGFDIGGKTTYYDSTSGIIYLTLGGYWAAPYWGTYYGKRGNIRLGRGYTIAGYNTNTNQMFVIPNTPFTIEAGTQTDHILKINGNIWITSTGVSARVIMYNPQTNVWSFPANITSTTVNARVQSLAYDEVGGNVYMAGSFTSATTGNYLTRYNLNTGTLSKVSCNGAGAVVAFMTFDPINRKLYVATTSISNATTSGGTITTLSGNGICIYDASNSVWENVRVDISGSVTAFCGDFVNNKLYVGMSGNTAGVSPNNITTNGLGVLNTSSYTWGNIGLTKSLIIGIRTIACATSMEMFRGNLIVGGGFTAVNNNSQINYAFKYIPSTNSISKITNNWFYVGPANTTTCITSFAIDQSSGTVYAQGKFGFSNNYNIKYFGSAGGLFRYDRTNDVLVDTNIYVRTTAGIRAHIQIDAGNVFIAGGYTNMSGGTFTNTAYTSHFHKWNINTNVFTSYGTFNEANGVYDMVYNPTNQFIYLVGLFSAVTQANNVVVNSSGIIKFNTQTGTFTSIASGITNISTAAPRIMFIDVSNQVIYFRSAKNSAPYTTYGGVSNQYGFAVFNITTETWTNLTVPVEASINIACAYFNPYSQKLYATSLSLTKPFYVYDTPTNTWTELPGLTNMLWDYFGNYIRYMDMDISNNCLFIAGSFYSISGQTHTSSIVKYDLNTNTVSRIGSSPDNILWVTGITHIYYESLDNSVYMIGGISMAKDKKMIGIAKYNITTDTWSSAFNNPKYSIMGHREGAINTGESTERNYPVGYMMFINDKLYLQTYSAGIDASYNFMNMAKTIIN